jgi:rhamnogalacturonyl hydrolase YesR
MPLKLVDSISYHLWTDALHARELARTTDDNWDRGTYVRWTVNTAWSAFEMVCEECLGTNGLGNRFKDNLDRAVAARGLSPLQWGQGIWQQVLDVYQKRKDYTHVSSSIAQTRLLASVQEADAAISVLRTAIQAIAQLSGATSPCGSLMIKIVDGGLVGRSLVRMRP